MKHLLFATLFPLLFTSSASAEITTKKQADEFIEKYCISLVNNLAKNLKRAEEITDEDEIFELIATSAETQQVIETYIRLCK